MVIDYQTDKRITRHLKILDALEVKPLVQNYLKCNGIEWTIARFKLLKSQLLQLLAGKKPKKEWVSYRKGVPRGIIGSLFKKALKTRREEKRVLSILNLYLAFMCPSNTKVKSCIQTIEDPPDKDCIPHIDSWSEKIQLWPRDMRRAKHIGSTCKPKFSFAGLNTSKPEKVDSEINQWVQSMEFTSSMSTPTSSLTRDFLPKKFSNERLEYAGNLVPLFERGNKVRIIAMPHAEIQVALKPLHDSLNRYLQSLNEDCTFDQEKGPQWVVGEFEQGKVVYSLDLSSATDCFPFKVQLSLLRKIMEWNHERFAQCFKDVMALPWKFNFKGETSYVTYGKGQSMGLYGSFALFAVTHHALLQTLCMELGYQSSFRPYRLLGDDVVISDQALAELYISTMQSLGVTISESKSFISNTLAEFAGFIIRTDDYYKPAKVPKNKMKVENLYAYLSVLESNPFIGHEWEEISNLILQYPQPLGLGKNPSGIPMMERFEWRSHDLEEKRPLTLDIIPHLVKQKFLRDFCEDFPNLPKEYYDLLPYHKRTSNCAMDMIYDISNDLRQEIIDDNNVLYGFDHRISRTLISDISKSNQGTLRSEDKNNYVRTLDFKKLFPKYPWKG